MVIDLAVMRLEDSDKNRPSSIIQTVMVLQEPLIKVKVIVDNNLTNWDKIAGVEVADSPLEAEPVMLMNKVPM